MVPVAQAFGGMALGPAVLLLLTWCAVAGKREWTVSTLHPALKA
jgi:putative membrane protein